MNLETILKSKLTFPLLSFACVAGTLGLVFFCWNSSYLTPENSVSAQYVRHAWGIKGRSDRASIAKQLVTDRSLIGLSKEQIVEIFGTCQTTDIDDEELGKSTVYSFPLTPKGDSSKESKTSAWLMIELTKDLVTKAWIEQ